jgi:hypothetical protein
MCFILQLSSKYAKLDMVEEETNMSHPSLVNGAGEGDASLTNLDPKNAPSCHGSTPP